MTTQITVRVNSTVDSMFRLLRSYVQADLIAREILQNAIIRRLSTNRGSYWTDPEYGFDLINFVNESITEESIIRLPIEIRDEILKEERVQDCQVEITELSGSYDNRIIKVKIYIVADTIGPFKFTLAIDSVTVKILTGEV